MKFLIICLHFLSATALAQSVGVKDIPASGDTTIKIEKGGREDIKFEITTGTDNIEGDPAPLLKEARENWKTACADWKKETRELNKENQLISLSCGVKKCSTTAMETTCVSEAKYKVKVRVK